MGRGTLLRVIFYEWKHASSCGKLQPLFFRLTPVSLFTSVNYNFPSGSYV
jgi:hypothetical protein